MLQSKGEDSTDWKRKNPVVKLEWRVQKSNNLFNRSAGQLVFHRQLGRTCVICAPG
jgi:hypothetical protein